MGNHLKELEKKNNCLRQGIQQSDIIVLLTFMESLFFKLSLNAVLF